MLQLGDKRRDKAKKIKILIKPSPAQLDGDRWSSNDHFANPNRPEAQS
jgi:hypothetical protein